jgi:pimeloyl-ACP methyl ester carboxylesterase
MALTRLIVGCLGGGVVVALSLGCGQDASQGSPESAASASGAAGVSGSGGGANSGGAMPLSGGVSPSAGAGQLAAGGSGATAGGSGGGNAGAGQGGASGGMTGSAGAGGSTAAGGTGGAGAVAKSDGCGHARTLKSGAITLQSGGQSRKYTLRVPDNYDQARPYRLILGFHGATGNSGQVAPSFFGLWSLSEGSTLFIAPDAVGGIWSSDTDVVFVNDILKQVKADLCIDTSRVELEGFSQGGAMAWTLACAQPSGVFRAAVVHSGGGLARPATCAPIAFMSSLGQQESNGAGQTSNSDFFAKQNGCQVAALAKAPGGGHACADYAGCSAGHATRWCDYDGGHTPSPSDAGQNMSWMPQEVWTFLKQF